MVQYRVRIFAYHTVSKVQIMAIINTVKLDLNFELINKLSSIDRFSGEWSNIERREGIHTLKQLKSIATVQSVGASTRIEGAKLTNDEIQVLLFENLTIDKLQEQIGRAHV